MLHDEAVRRSRWLLRVMEWNDSRARYPNLWLDGMPRHVLAADRSACRLRLGDLVAVFYPASQIHADRSERYVGLSRVTGLRESGAPGFAWIDLRTEHRFEPPLALRRQPRRVFLCCDPGWPEQEVTLFQQVFDAAVAAGWRPAPEDQVEPAAPSVEAHAAEPGPETEPEPATPLEATPDSRSPAPRPAGRTFAGADFSGDMRDPREGTWLAVVELRGERLGVTRLEATGRHGLETYLRNPHRALMEAEAIGLDFPFGLPIAFAEKLLGGPFPETGWWALARRLERVTRPEFLSAIQEFREQHGEPKRLTDEIAQACSPLHRVNPDLGPMTFHGIRMIAADRSRFALRPFESAQGKLLLEVYPGALSRAIGRGAALVDALAALEQLPVDLSEAQRAVCLARRDALDAVIAARLAAAAVLAGETERGPEELAPGQGARVRLEGWIYGLDRRDGDRNADVGSPSP